MDVIINNKRKEARWDLGFVQKQFESLSPILKLIYLPNDLDDYDLIVDDKLNTFYTAIQYKDKNKQYTIYFYYINQNTVINGNKESNIFYEYIITHNEQIIYNLLFDVGGSLLDTNNSPSTSHYTYADTVKGYRLISGEPLCSNQK